MEERMIFAGAGGQGLMILGKLLAQSAMTDGFHVTWFPSYGAEVRGGTAHCHLVVSDEEIYTPLVERASALLIMNEPSLKRFLPRLAPGGLLALNTTLASVPVGLDRAVIEVPATDIANELGNIRVANMVMLGALNARKHLASEATILSTAEAFLGASKKAALAANIAAYRKGCELGAK